MLKDSYQKSKVKNLIAKILGITIGYLVIIMLLGGLLYLLWNNIVYPYPSVKVSFRQAVAIVLFIPLIRNLASFDIKVKGKDPYER